MAGQPDDPLGPAWLEEAMRDITSLGSTIVLVLIVVATTLYLVTIGRRRAALFVLVAVGGGQILSSLLKLGIERPRPELVSHLARVSDEDYAAWTESARQAGMASLVLEALSAQARWHLAAGRRSSARKAAEEMLLVDPKNDVAAGILSQVGSTLPRD